MPVSRGALYVANQQRALTGGQLTVMDGQLTEMKNSSGDTRLLAESASKQAGNMEKLAITAAEQSEATQLSANQAKRAADIGEATLKSVNESARRDQRAWVGIHGAIHRDFAVGSKATVGFAVMNSGKTPALDFRGFIAARALRKLVKFEPEFPKNITQESIHTLHP